MVRSLYISYNSITEPIVQSQVIPYLRELSKNGIKFYLLTFEKEKVTDDKRSEINKYLKREFHNDANLEWFHLRYHKRPTLPATVFDVTVGTFYSLYLILKNKIKIVHSRAIVAALLGFVAAKLLSKKFIFDTRGIDSEEYVDGGLWKRGGLKHRMVGFIEKYLTKHSDRVIVLTEKFSEILKEKYQDKNINFSVIPCAVDTDRFASKEYKNQELLEKLELKNKFVITYTGSLGTWYMLNEMLDFFKTAIKIIKNIHFLILTQSDKAQIVDLIREKELDMSYFTIDKIPYEHMPLYLSLSDVGIYFIKPVFSKLSSSPIKFAEYLSNGLPVIINSGIGDTDSLVRRYRLGVVIDEFNQKSYINAIETVMKMLRTEKGELKSRCRRAAEEELSLKTAVDQYCNIYQSITKG